jgi:hypothetical protein
MGAASVRQTASGAANLRRTLPLTCADAPDQGGRMNARLVRDEERAGSKCGQLPSGLMVRSKGVGT